MSFIRKLKELKVITKNWAKESRAQDVFVLEKLEDNIKDILQ